MKGNGICIILLMAVVMCSCSNGFTKEERELIGNSGDGIMRLYVVDNESDSVLLRQKAAPMGEKELRSDRFETLKQRMLETVNDSLNPGVGIAAPQVGISRRLIAVQRLDKEGEPFEFYVNPEIINYSDDKVTGTEGCLSVPGRSGRVSRSGEIMIRYIDENSMAEKLERISGFTAVIFQHEIDHLNGIIYTDRLIPETESGIDDY